MPDPAHSRPATDQLLMVMRIVTAALITGVAVYLVFVLSRNPLGQPPAGQQLSLIAIGFAMITTLLQFAVPLIVRQEPADHPASNVEQQAAALFFTRHIFRLALLEGAAFFNTTALMMERNSWTLVIIGVLVLLMLVQWPTRDRLEQFIENRRLEASFQAPP